MCSAMFLSGSTSPALTYEGIQDQNILCEAVEGNDVQYIVIGNAVLANIRPVDVPGDPCGLFATQGSDRFYEVGTCDSHRTSDC